VFKARVVLWSSPPVIYFYKARGLNMFLLTMQPIVINYQLGGYHTYFIRNFSRLVSCWFLTLVRNMINNTCRYHCMQLLCPSDHSLSHQDMLDTILKLVCILLLLYLHLSTFVESSSKSCYFHPLPKSYSV